MSMGRGGWGVEVDKSEQGGGARRAQKRGEG